MNSSIECTGNTDAAGRHFGLRGAIAALATLVAALAGCNRDEAVRAFRSGSSDQLQAGAEAIALGVINGVFSAFDVGTGDSADANTSGASTGGDSSTTATP